MSVNAPGQHGARCAQCRAIRLIRFGRNLRPRHQPPQEGPQLVALQDPQPGPAELVNLPSLEWLKADMSFFTFFPLHFGQDTSWFPKTRVSKVFLHFSHRYSKIGIGSHHPCSMFGHADYLFARPCSLNAKLGNYEVRKLGETGGTSWNSAHPSFPTS